MCQIVVSLWGIWGHYRTKVKDYDYLRMLWLRLHQVSTCWVLGGYTSPRYSGNQGWGDYRTYVIDHDYNREYNVYHTKMNVTLHQYSQHV